MKKIITLLAIIMFTGLSVKLKAQLVPSNETTTVNGDPSTTLVGQVTITNTSTNPVSVKVLRTYNNCAPGHQSYFCVGTNCYPPTTSASPVFILPHDSSALLLADAETNGTNGNDMVSYLIYDVNDSANDKISVNFTYDFATGINPLNPFAGNYLVCFQSNNKYLTSISYNLTDFNNGKLIIRNLLGAVIKEIMLADRQGVINVSTAGLPAGLYMFFLYNNDVPVATKKMVILH